MIYLILLAVIGFLAFIDYIDVDSTWQLKRLNNFKSYIFYIIILFLILFVGLRYYVGLDYGNYVKIFYSIYWSNDGDGVELGYKILNQIVGFFTDGFMPVFFTMALFTMTVKAYAIKKESNRIFFSFFICFTLYFLVGDMGQIRSTFAQSIDLLALYFYLKDSKKDKITAFCLIVFSMLFHSSSICMLAIFLIKDRKFTTKKYIWIYIILLILGQFLSLKILGYVGSQIGGTIGGKLSAYTTNPEFAKKVGLSFNVIFDFLMFVFILYMRSKYKLNSKKFTVLFNVYFIGICSYLIFNNYFVLATRFANYFRLALVFLIPMLLNKIKDKRIRMLVVAIFIVVLSLMFIRFLNSNSALYFPYRMKLFGNIIGG